MKVVYLDQNAASYLAVPTPGSSWEILREVLVRGFQAERICCPMPMETLVESAPCAAPLRTAIERLFREVGGGTRFRSYQEILIDATLALVRPGQTVIRVGIIGNGWAERHDAAQHARESHAEALKEMRRRSEDYQFPVGAERMSVREILRSAMIERSRAFQQDLQSFIANVSSDLSRFRAKWLMRGLIDKSLTRDEAERLSDVVSLRKWAAILENGFDLLLGSQWDHDALHRQRPRYDPNDEVDRQRAAVALARADVFVTDSYLADLCRKVRVSRYSKTAVFSVKETVAILSALNATEKFSGTKP